MNQLPAKKAQQIAALLKRGFSVRDVAKRANVSRNSVQARIDLLVFNPHTKDQKAIKLHNKVIKIKSLLRAVNKLLEGM